MRQNQMIEAVSDRICQAFECGDGPKLASVARGLVVLVGHRKRGDPGGFESHRHAILAGIALVLGYAAHRLPVFGSQFLPVPRRHECFVAGTPVWTVSGPVAIEKIRVGDLVLSQALDTGELAFQPVLQTTQRPRSR